MRLIVGPSATCDPPDGISAFGARQGRVGGRQRLGMPFCRYQWPFALCGLYGHVIPSSALRDDPERIVAVLGRDTSCSFVRHLLRRGDGLDLGLTPSL